jgi:hypothetical protein
MTGYQKKAIEGHVSLCSHCLSDVIYFRAAEVEDTPEPVFKPIPLSIKTKIFVEEKATELKVLWEKACETINNLLVNNPIAVPAYARYQGNAVPAENILPFYKINSLVDSENQVILLDAPENCSVELEPLSRFLDGPVFYYKVFGIYKEGDKENVRVICSASEQYLPIKIERPDTNYLIVCLSIDENTLNDKANHLLKVINDRSKEKIDNLICLMIDIVENA